VWAPAEADSGLDTTDLYEVVEGLVLFSTSWHVSALCMIAVYIAFTLRMEAICSSEVLKSTASYCSV
jgi:hypothetical protein